jgi:hypothetical protein
MLRSVAVHSSYKEKSALHSGTKERLGQDCLRQAGAEAVLSSGCARNAGDSKCGVTARIPLADWTTITQEKESH